MRTAIVEDAGNADVGVARSLERLDQDFGLGSAADDHGAAVEAPLPDPVTHQPRDEESLAKQSEQGCGKPGGDPYAGEVLADLAEECATHHAGNDGRPGERDP